MPAPKRNASAKLSIGLMAMNSGKFIVEAIESILAQSMKDWEMVISDDGSTDGTDVIVAPFLSDPRITYILHPVRLGQASNWQFCMNQGTAPIVCVLHADDAYVPGVFELVQRTFEANVDVDFFFGNSLRFRKTCDPSGRVLLRERVGWDHFDRKIPGSEAWVLLIRHNHALPSCSFLRRSLVAKSGPPDQELSMRVDQEFFQRVAAASRYVAFTNRVVCRYREHDASATAQCDKSGVTERECDLLPSIIRRNLNRYGLMTASIETRLNVEIRGLVHYRAHVRLGSSAAAACKADWPEATRLLWSALVLDPRLLLSPKAMIDVCLICCRQGWILRQIHWKRQQGIIGGEVANLVQ